MVKKLTYCFDLDGTLCTQTRDSNYLNAKPLAEAITEVNRLFDEGHTIIIDTARGSSSGIDWKSKTENQLREWGVKYHLLQVGKKINADIFVDDKAVNAVSWRLLIQGVT
jgi:dTDP-glucose 4,6-dehydratase